MSREDTTNEVKSEARMAPSQRSGPPRPDPTRRANQHGPELPANEGDMAILGPLRALDPVAYLRFVSAYKAFISDDDLEDEIVPLCTNRPTGHVSWSPTVSRHLTCPSPWIGSGNQ